MQGQIPLEYIQLELRLRIHAFYSTRLARDLLGGLGDVYKD